ncbi:acetyltransferase [Mangrovibacter phragmitis]|uniref:Acetyltransferase n=1 Tax=Mangrovibacter phragmitis TaxID=1691903 RepID=A0A1B7L7F6_9ENTR|nr:GNAT family N-acetyltransferase [Mangrovibacter phragmitis]OAT78195.1 acetyltransferase [Mangrovibacter phragmitis]
MITFRPMREDEYPGYLEYFITDYAREITENYKLTPDDALTRARKEIAESLPGGVKTPGHVLVCLISHSGDSEKHIGYLWYKPDAIMRSVYIYDFYIFDTCQGQGLGKHTLWEFEHEMQTQGFAEIRLRVAGDNERARHVYEAVGFGVTGINMSKNIKN